MPSLSSSSQTRLLRSLAKEGIDRRVLRAMAAIPRAEFVTEDDRASAYEDTALSIGYGQTISQPYIVAFMTEKLELLPTDRVLEVGTGSGYQAAVLSKLVAEVYTVEIVPELAEQAAERFKKLGLSNINARLSDGSLGWLEMAPYDCIMVTCAPDHVPMRLINQMNDVGRMILPVGGRHRLQHLELLRKRQGRIVSAEVLPVRFVPMVGQVEHE